MQSKARSILSIVFAVSGVAVLIGAIRLVQLQEKPAALPTPPVATQTPAATPTPEPVETSQAPRPIQPRASTKPEMDVAVGHGAIIKHQTESDYPVFTHALCADGVVHPLRFEKINPLRHEFDVQYALDDGAKVQDICVVFRGYDPSTVQLLKAQALDSGCTLDSEGFNTCARTPWELCDDELKGDKRFCQTIHLLPDLDARVYTTTDQKTCAYRALFLYKGKELVWDEDKGTFKSEVEGDPKLQCMWEGADGEYGDDQRFPKNRPNKFDNNIPLIFAVGATPHVVRSLAGMEGWNWHINALQADKLETVQHTYYYGYH